VWGGGVYLGDGDGQQVGVHKGVQVQNVVHLRVRLLLGGVRAVPLLPQELARADEGGGVAELPAHHVGPLIELQGQVPPAADPLQV